jgi:hypothetical protein
MHYAPKYSCTIAECSIAAVDINLLVCRVALSCFVEFATAALFILTRTLFRRDLSSCGWVHVQ